MRSVRRRLMLVGLFQTAVVHLPLEKKTVISGRMQKCQRHCVRGTSRTMHACGTTFLNCHRSSVACQPSELTVRSVRTDSHVSQDLQSDQSEVTVMSVSQNLLSCQLELTVRSVITYSHVSQNLQSDQSEVTVMSVSQNLQSCQSEHTVMSFRTYSLISQNLQSCQSELTVISVKTYSLISQN